MTSNILLFVLLLCFLAKLGYTNGTCTIVGFQCDKDKKKVEFCRKINVDPDLIEACEGEQVCKQENHNVRCIDPGNVDMKFICTGKGEFPDVKDCSRTYTCEAEGKEPSEVCTCPTGDSVYPIPGLFCMPGKCPRENVTCTEGAHGFLTLPNDQRTSYYYYCLSSDTVLVYDDVEVSSPGVTNEFDLTLNMARNGKNCAPYGGN